MDGDADDLNALLTRHLPGLLAFVRLRAGKRLRERESTHDLALSACREVLEDGESVPRTDEAAFRRWLYLAAERKILDRARYHGRARRDADRREAIPDAGLAEETRLLARAYASVAPAVDVAIQREEILRLEAAFLRLPDSYREIIILSRIVGLPHRQIADETGRSEVAVRGLLHRALARLSILIETVPAKPLIG